MLVNSTLGVTPLYNPQDSLYPEETQEATAGNKYKLAASQKNYYRSKHGDPSSH